MTQAEALAILKTGVNVFLTGEPGSGKTHTINRYIEYLKSSGAAPAVTASTGIAATHIGGMTIHAWSGIGIKRALSASDLDRLAAKPMIARRVGRAKILIIDEVSMLDAELLSLVEAVCRRVRLSEEPFGGLQVVLAGDFFQLPPVGQPGGPKPEFAFRSPAWGRASFRVCYLEEQHRQVSDPLHGILRAIREGRLDASLREHIVKRHGRPLATEEVSELYAHNADVDRLNAQKLALLDGPSRSFIMRSSGKAPVVEQLKRGCLSPEVLELKPGALVMFTKNNPEAGFYNGTLGRVEKFAEDGSPVVVTHAGARITVRALDWSIEENEKVLGSITQLPLRLAWAITIHKSQGMSMDAAVMDLSRTFEYGQGYVALSRVRLLAGIYLIGINERAFEVNASAALEDRNFHAASERALQELRGISGEDLALKQAQFLRKAGGSLKEQSGEAKPAGSSKYDLSSVRKSHPNAYRPWSEEEETDLLRYFGENRTIADIAALLRRQKGGIRSRLRKLGKLK